MGKAAAKRVTSTTAVEDDIDARLATINAGSQFLGATINMGWRLALTVVIPIVGGVKLDEKLNSSPSYTLLGMIIAAAAGSAVVWATVKEVNAQQAEQPTKHTRKSKEKN